MSKIINRLKQVPALLGGRLMVGEAKLSAVIHRADGRVEDLGVIARKKITSAWIEFMVDVLQAADATFSDFKWHDSGTGTNAENNGDTALQTPTGVARVAGTQIEGATANIYKSVATIVYDGTYAVVEHGLFNINAAGTLLDRSVFGALTVNNGDDITWTYEATFNAET